MPRQATVPFHLSRSQEQFAVGTMTSTKETIHGLIRLEGDRLLVQWRLARRTEHLGSALVRSEEETGSVREAAIPLAGVAGALVRRRGWLPRKEFAAELAMAVAGRGLPGGERIRSLPPGTPPP